MNKRIFCIGVPSLTKEHDALLSSKGYRLLKFKNINSILYRDGEGPDLLLIDHGQCKMNGFRVCAETFSALPKIIFFDTPSLRGFSAWKRFESVFPLYDPSPKELLFCVDQAFSYHNTAKENSFLKTQMAALTREHGFFEDINRALTSTLDLSDVLSHIMKKVQKILSAESWSVLVLNEETNELVFEKTSGKKGTGRKIKKMRLKLGEGIAGWVAQEKIPVVVPDVTKDPRFSSRVDQEIHYQTRSLLSVPILSNDRVLGVIEVVNKTTNEPFTKEDLQLLLKIVDHIAIAIERASLYQKMEELSITDDLTKLFNTRYLNRTLEIEINRANRHKASLSLIFMDVDHFKVINDNYGHLVGSKLLVEMGQLLLKSLRTVDIVARYGGDEFVIVLPQTAPKYAIQIAERIRRSIEHAVFLKKEGYSLKMTASFGVASYPESAKTKEDVLRLADEAMYRVKYQTRNGVYAIV